MDKILIVEDDILLNRGIKLALEKNNYSVACSYTYSEGYSYFTAESFNLILLDINLPDKSGLELCKQIRKTSQVPIIFITANDTEQEVVRGFLSGCDDYMAKPFSLEVLYRRIQAVLRRMGRTENNVFSSGEILIDYDKMQVKRADETVKLTATEYRLLTLLTKNSGQVLTRRSILEKLWDVDEAFVDENALSVNMRRLRQKLEKDPKKPYYIKTVFGIGYTWGGW
ncbi:response regulator transcription factor [Ruminiclostridium cellobioparum]|jgi:DNA-binding response OmpR family regulator|uniref:response regulator transcription factor n=1 Tax=Ruminiclostridium cellobioparum TaxID=29355 RepID=UPI0004821F54|nr:response regulator transcription factor [Ruminiclostridium cellobioparum]